MATGRIGTTPVLQVRWSKAPAGGTTSLSGLDDNSVSLVYSVGYEAVYRNGVLLSRGNDYTATNGTTITLVDATIAGDIIEVFANELVPLTDAISKGQFTAKGALLSATAASTPGVLTVGSNDQVLTADSTTSTGLKWATPASGGMTLITTTGFSTGTTSLSSIPSTFTNLFVVISDMFGSSDGAELDIQFNTNTGSVYRLMKGTTVSESTAFRLDDFITTSAQIGKRCHGTLLIPNYATSDTGKICQINMSCSAAATDLYRTFQGIFEASTAISSIQFKTSTGTFSGGTVYLYGVK